MEKTRHAICTRFNHWSTSTTLALPVRDDDQHLHGGGSVTYAVGGGMGGPTHVYSVYNRLVLRMNTITAKLNAIPTKAMIVP